MTHGKIYEAVQRFISVLVLLAMLIAALPATSAIAAIDAPGDPEAPDVNVNYVSQIGGVSQAVAVCFNGSGVSAYVAVGPRLVELNPSASPVNPPVVSQSEPLMPGGSPINTITDIALNAACTEAYLAAGDSGVVKINLATMQISGQPAAVPDARRLAVNGSTVYAAAGDNGLYIVDLGTMTALGSIDLGETVEDVDFRIDMTEIDAYVVTGDPINGTGDLRVVDVSTPNMPAEVVTTDYTGITYGQAVTISNDGNTAFVADSDGASLHSFLIEGAGATEAPLSSLFLLEFPLDITLNAAGTAAFLAVDIDGLRYVDVSDPLDLEFAATSAISLPGASSSVATFGNFVYTANLWEGMQIVNISALPTMSNPGGFAQVGTPWGVNAELPGVVMSASSLYGLAAVDVDPRSAPEELSRLTSGMTGLVEGAQNVDVVGDTAFVAAGNNGLSSVDISDPAAPSILDTSDAVSANDVLVDGDYAYIADSAYGLWIANVSDPAAFTSSGELATPGTGIRHALDKLGDIVYLAAGVNGLRIIDVSDVANPSELGSFPVANALDVVAFSRGMNTYVAVAAGSTGVQIVDVTNPAAPSSVVLFPAVDPVTGYAQGLALWQDTLLVAGGADGLVIVDISTLNLPAILGDYATSGSAFGVALAGAVYVGAQDAGLYVLDYPLFSDGDLAITKTDGLTTITAGNPITYTITVSNVGLTDVDSAAVSDAFTGLTDISWTCVATLGATCAASGMGALVSQPVTLPYGSSVTFTAMASIPVSFAGELSNTATVSFLGDVDTSNNSATDLTDVIALPDLAIDKTGPATIIAGEDITYTFDYANLGAGIATNALISDTLPTGLTFSSVTPLDACSAVGQLVTCDLGTLDPMDSGTISITAAVDGLLTAGPISNTATISNDTGDASPDTNRSTAVTTVSRSVDLTLTKVDALDPVFIGTQFTYSLTVSNAGPSTATGVLLTDTLPDEVSFFSAAGCTYDMPSHTVSCSLANIAAGDDVTVDIVVNAETSGTALNTATVSANETDTNPLDNDAEQGTVINNLTTNLSLGFTGTPDTLKTGQDLTYSVTVTNNSATPGLNATVIVQLDGNLDFVSADAGCVYDLDAHTVTCSFGSIAGNGNETLDIVVTSLVAGPQTSQATLFADNDSTPGNNILNATDTFAWWVIYMPLISK